MLLAIVIVAGSVVHAVLIEGTMETVSKAALCALVLAAAIKVMIDLRCGESERRCAARALRDVNSKAAANCPAKAQMDE